MNQKLLKKVRFEDLETSSKEYARINYKYKFIIACFDNDMSYIQKYLAHMILEKDIAMRAMQIAYFNNNITLLNILIQNGANISDLPELHQQKIIDMLMPEI